MIKAEAYLDFTNNDIQKGNQTSDISNEIIEISFGVGKHVAYLLKDESYIDPRINFDLIPPPIILSNEAYSKILIAKANNENSTNINVLIRNRYGKIYINKINTNKLHLVN